MQETYGNIILRPFLGELGEWVFHIFPRLHSIMGKEGGGGGEMPP